MTGKSSGGSTGDNPIGPTLDLVLYDASICHASEDKDALARPLAESLRAEHIEIWYDEFSLKVGDSLRRSIDRGLSPDLS